MTLAEEQEEQSKIQVFPTQRFSNTDDIQGSETDTQVLHCLRSDQSVLIDHFLHFHKTNGVCFHWSFCAAFVDH